MNRREMHKHVRDMTNTELVERNEELYHMIIKNAVAVIEEKEDTGRKEQIENLFRNISIQEVDVMPQTTIRPVKPVTETVADISISGNYIHISFLERDEDFREIIKEHGFSWGGFGVGWERKCNQFTGSTLDRATEISILLLKAGFIISIVEDTLKEKILKKEYTPEQKRWIFKRTSGSYNGWFSVEWEYGNETIYKAARAIGGSRWSKPSVVVPSYQYEAIQDIAEAYNFKLSPGAIDLIESAKKTKEESLIVDMSETIELPIEEKPKKEEFGICASLRDDD